MVVRNKAHKLVNKYKEILNKRFLGATLQNKKSIRSKNKILDFFLKSGAWPNRNAKTKKERSLAMRFENYVSKESFTYDKNMRRIAMATGRTTNNKRKHNSALLKKEILDFIKLHGRAPMGYRDAKIEGEGTLRGNLHRYTLEYGDMTFLGEVYALDPCHRSGIPSKYRALINEALNVEKPLIRLV